MSGNTKNKQFWAFRAGIHVSNQEGIRILSIATPWSNLGDAINISGKITLKCHIPKIPLVPGRYFISIGCQNAKRQVDWLENICLLNVIPNENIAKKFIPIYKTHGYFLTNAEWEIEKR
jgi:hypothetical protein